MKKWLKKISVMLLCAVIIASAFPATAFAKLATYGEVVYASVNFDNCPTTDGYGDLSSNGINASFIPSNECSVQITTENAIENVSARCQALDIRWWGLALQNKDYGLSLDFRLNESQFQGFYIGVENQDAATSFDYDEGHIIKMVKEIGEEKTSVYNREGEKLTELDDGVLYHIELGLTTGQDTFSVTINGETVSTDSKLYSTLQTLKCVRLFVMGEKNNQSEISSDIMIDNFKLYTGGWVYPQTYSAQAPGEIPGYDYPAHYVDTDAYSVYYNTELQNFTSEDIYVSENNAWLSAEKVIALLAAEIDAVSYEVKDGKYLLNFTNGACLDITAMVEKVEDADVLSLASINEIFGAKVWLDTEGQMILLTTGSMIDDGFLYACGYRYVMNGEPYYEISFNKYNLYLNIMSYFSGQSNEDGVTGEAILEEEEAALRTLSENGFRSIRVFVNNPWSANYNIRNTEEGKALYFQVMDTMFDMCDKYGIKVVATLKLDADMFLEVENVNGTWVTVGEQRADLIADPDSASRQNVYEFLDECITRYADRNTVLMWEVGNEILLDADIGHIVQQVQPSAIQVGEFYSDITEYIHNIDKNHLVSSGDARLRAQQWNFLKYTMSGGTVGVGNDTAEEQYQLMYIVNKGIDVLSGHSQSASAAEFATYMDYARSFNKPYYVGEGGIEGTCNYLDSNGNFIPECVNAAKEYLSRFAESGLQLMHWWDFEAPNRSDNYLWEVSMATTPDLFYAIADMNKEFQAAKMVNGAADVDTYTEETSMIAKTCLVNLAYNDGTDGKEVITVVSGYDLPAVTVPAREGYVFEGYFDAAEAGNRYYNADGTGAKAWDLADGTVLYAQWSLADETAPVIEGVEDGKTYCGAQTVTVKEDNLVSVTVNGNETGLDEEGKFVINPAEGEQVIGASDAAGNVTTIKVTVNSDHQYEWKIDKAATAAEKGSKHEECTVCGDKKDAVEIPPTGTSGGSGSTSGSGSGSGSTSGTTSGSGNTSGTTSTPAQTAQSSGDSQTTASVATPGTGDNSNWALLLVLTLMVGGLGTGAIAVRRRMGK